MRRNFLNCLILKHKRNGALELALGNRNTKPGNFRSFINSILIRVFGVTACYCPFDVFDVPLEIVVDTLFIVVYFFKGDKDVRKKGEPACWQK